LSTDSTVTANELRKFLPEKNFYRLPVLASSSQQPSGDFSNEREILYKLFFDMKKDVTELKKMFLEILQNPALAGNAANYARESLLNEHNINGEIQKQVGTPAVPQMYVPAGSAVQPMILHDGEIHQHAEVEESLNIMDKEKELIIKALKKHRGKRKDAASDLGISERTLYRKLKEYDIEE